MNNGSSYPMLSDTDMHHPHGPMAAISSDFRSLTATSKLLTVTTVVSLATKERRERSQTLPATSPPPQTPTLKIVKDLCMAGGDGASILSGAGSGVSS